MTTSGEAVVTDYVEAWNDHDSQAIVETFAEGRTYTDPRVGELSGQAIGEYANGIWRAFPDLSFDGERLTSTNDGTVLLQLDMRGTHDGPLQELQPTGESIALPATDLIRTGDNGITSVRGYFDVQSMLEQLGLRIDVHPHRQGPLRFGSSFRLDLGSTAEPGAFSLTSISWRDAEDKEAISVYVNEIVEEMAEMDGVISALYTYDKDRAYSITAWENSDDARQLMKEGPHKSAVQATLESDGLGAAVMTRVWTLDRMNGRLVRCDECLEMTRDVQADDCPNCGAPLQPEPPYW